MTEYIASGYRSASYRGILAGIRGCRPVTSIERPVPSRWPARSKRCASRPGWGLLSTLTVRGEPEEDALTRLLSTHPDTDKRIDRLLDRADREGQRRRIEIRSGREL